MIVTSERERFFSTPQRLRLFLAGIWLFTLLFWWVSYYSLADTRHYIQIIGRDCVPSIVAAQGIRARLANANACAVNATLASEAESKTMWTRCDFEIATANDLLVTAAQNITLGDRERQPILKIAQTIPRYTAALATVRETTGADRVARMVAASNIMRGEILNAADILDTAHVEPLNQTYYESASALTTACAGEITATIALLAAFLWAQLYFFQHFRRVVNPLIFVAMLAMCADAFMNVESIFAAHAALKVAKQDAFDSIHVLSKARAIAFDARADQSLWLLDSNVPSRETDFNRKATLLVGEKISDDAMKSIARGGRITFNGLLADELKNITFEAELDAATKTLDAWNRCMQVDSVLRVWERSSNHAKAVDLCTGVQRGSTNFAFDEFDKAINVVMTINQNEFDKAIAEAFAALEPAGYWLPAVSLICLLFAWLGTAGRLREYA